MPQPSSDLPSVPFNGASEGSVGHPITPAALDEALLGEPRSLTAEQLCEDAGVSEAFAQEYWRSLGLPIAPGGHTAFTTADARALREIAGVATEEGFDDSTVSTLIRSIGHTMDRLALWQVEALVDHTARAENLDDADARRELLSRLPSLQPMLESQLLHAWRRQLAALAGRYAIEFAPDGSRGESVGELPLPRAVGFADIVSFTKRTAGLGSAELAAFVQSFESNARDIITGEGGRVVKTIGDAVLFIADDATTGARVALRLAERRTAIDARTSLPVRVSLVWGRVLSRFGDVFGPSVNLASRLTEEAQPGTVLVDPATAEIFANTEEFDLMRLAARELQGFGEVTPYRLNRAAEQHTPGY